MFMPTQKWLWMPGIILGLTVGLLSGCRVGDAQTLVTIEAQWQGFFSEATEPQEWVIADPETWAAVWHQTNPGIPPSPVPAIDFSRSMVIGAALGQRMTGGYEVRITEIVEQAGELVVRVEQVAPPPDAMTIAALTQPFHLVQIPRSTLPVRFAWNEPPTQPDHPSSGFEGVY